MHLVLNRASNIKIKRTEKLVVTDSTILDAESLPDTDIDSDEEKERKIEISEEDTKSDTRED